MLYRRVSRAAPAVLLYLLWGCLASCRRIASQASQANLELPSGFLFSQSSSNPHPTTTTTTTTTTHAKSFFSRFISRSSGKDSSTSMSATSTLVPLFRFVRHVRRKDIPASEIVWPSSQHKREASRRRSVSPFRGTGMGRYAFVYKAVEPQTGLPISERMATASPEEEKLYSLMLELGQTHLFDSWPVVGEKEAEKHAFFQQLAASDAAYPGGLKAYITKARDLLASAVRGDNPFEGMIPSVPDGESLEFDTPDFLTAEEEGLCEGSQTAFVLVAGGLGERLGYSGIKLALPVETTTGQCYLQYYVNFILALQSKCRRALNDPTITLPLAIMTSDDTDAKTRELLEAKNYFGMPRSQLHIMKQDKVPALKDSDARLAMTDSFELDTKPHGHGDVHHLLLRNNLAHSWLASGKKWVFFMQDTNALVVNSVLPALSVSSSNAYDMNSICIPRKAGEAAGAITKLTDPNGFSIVINVEYNQLDPLLRATTYPEGDVNDPETGNSPFPGNANNLVFNLPNYVRCLMGEDQGVVSEFVNPKFKDQSRTAFTKPTRLECMMQDFPKLLVKEIPDTQIGFTSFEKWLSFSPAKNSLDAGAKGVKTGTPPATTSSAEMEFYEMNVRKLVAAGADIEAPHVMEFASIPLHVGARVVIQPSFAITSQEIKSKVQGLRVSARSTLVLDGEGIRVEGLDLDGTLVLRVCEGAEVVVKDAVIKNAGWHFVPLKEYQGPDPILEEDIIRGYKIERKEGRVVEISKPGKYELRGEGELVEVEADDEDQDPLGAPPLAA